MLWDLVRGKTLECSAYRGATVETSGDRAVVLEAAGSEVTADRSLCAFGWAQLSSHRIAFCAVVKQSERVHIQYN